MWLRCVRVTEMWIENLSTQFSRGQKSIRGEERGIMRDEWGGGEGVNMCGGREGGENPLNYPVGVSSDVLALSARMYEHVSEGESSVRVD